MTYQEAINVARLERRLALQAARSGKTSEARIHLSTAERYRRIADAAHYRAMQRVDTSELAEFGGRRAYA